LTILQIFGIKVGDIKEIQTGKNVILEGNMAKKNRIKRDAIEVPENLEEAEHFLNEIGETGREIEEIEIDLNREIESWKNEATKEIRPLVEKVQRLFEGLYAYAESHRSELTEGGKSKTVFILSGEFGWRLTPPAVTVKGAEKVLEKLHSMGLEKFIRTKEEINKEAMLADQEKALKVPGVKIGQHEEFFAKPSDVAEVSAPAERLRKKVS
jgi:phage host-nuclease inhibitor protein Gam